MATNRLELLKQMVAQDPKNSFARYGLAMELVAQGQAEEAVREFKSLIADDPDYVAAYYHAGQVLEKQGELGGAKAIYEQGLEACARKGDTHTGAEIEAAMSLLPI